jgi:integrase
MEDMGRRRFQKPNVFKTKGKNPQWGFRVRVDAITSHDGEKGIDRPEKRYYLGLVKEIGKREAEKLRDEILSEAINKPQVLIPSQVLFSEVLRLYRTEHLPHLRETTRETQESAIRRHFAALGKYRMCDLDKLAIQRWVASLNLATSTKAWNLSLLRLIWGKAEEWEYVQRSFPKGKFAMGQSPDRQVKGREMPSLDQLRKLLAVLEDPYRAMAEVALYSGLRISEIRGLQWGDVGQHTLTVRRRMSIRGDVDITKNGKERIFDVRPLAEVLERVRTTSGMGDRPAASAGTIAARTVRASREILSISDQDAESQGDSPLGGFGATRNRLAEAPFEPANYIFEAAGCYSTCNHVMRRAAKKAGITVARFGWHHLRACCNTLMRGAGGDSLDRQALMGHADARTNAVYVMAQDSDLRRRGDLMMQVQNLILGEVKGVQ